MQNRDIAMHMLRAKIYAFKVAEQEAKVSADRKLKVGTGERSEKIRTYNYPQKSGDRSPDWFFPAKN